MHKILKFNENPPAKNYNHHAFGTGIITSIPEGMNYMYNNYIQLVYYPGYGKFSFDYFMDYIYCQPVFDREHIHDETMSNMNIDVMSYIEDAVMAGKYVVLCVNEYYIPDRAAFLTFSFRHNLLIYGYDTGKREFDVAGYDEAGHFSVQKLDRKNLKKAKPDNITLLGFREDYDFSLNPEWIRYQIDAYYGKKQQPMFGSYKAEGRYTGEEAVKLMCRDMLEGLSRHEPIDVRPFTLLTEHGRLMQDRLVVLKEYGYTEEEEILYWNKECERRELLLKRIYMYNCTLDGRNAEKIKKYVDLG